jgi:hypothetical protein
MLQAAFDPMILYIVRHKKHVQDQQTWQELKEYQLPSMIDWDGDFSVYHAATRRVASSQLM